MSPGMPVQQSVGYNIMFAMCNLISNGALQNRGCFVSVDTGSWC